jgi:hypothetical protein
MGRPLDRRLELDKTHSAYAVQRLCTDSVISTRSIGCVLQALSSYGIEVVHCVLVPLYNLGRGVVRSTCYKRAGIQLLTVFFIQTYTIEAIQGPVLRRIAELSVIPRTSIPFSFARRRIMT